MSFAVWDERPPFEFTPEDAEQIYPVGDKFVVTDDSTLATQEQVDAVLNSVSEPTPDPIAILQSALEAKGILVADDLTTASASLSAKK